MGEKIFPPPEDLVWGKYFPPSWKTGCAGGRWVLGCCQQRKD